MSQERRPQPAWRNKNSSQQQQRRRPRDNRQGGYRNRRDEDKKLRPLEVEVRGGDIFQACRILKKKMSDEGILRELRVRRHAEKPSEKKRRKAREALKRARKSKGRARRLNLRRRHDRSKVVASVPLSTTE